MTGGIHPTRRALRRLLAAGALAAVLAPGTADACGGTFCDSGPTAMPVDQKGENILFVMDGTNVEVHIQIQYEGDAERFAWVLPLPTIPELEIGSQPLFLNLLNGSVPRYGFTQTFCGTAPPLAPEGGGGPGSDGSVTEAQAAEVLLRETVGAFDVTVLSGSSAQEVVDWLVANGYDQPPGAEPIIAEYVASGHVFAAVKLLGGTDVDEIHPIIVRYPGDTPAIPLKLTAVGAVDDMFVRAFVLGDGRWVPTSFAHLELNPVVLDWASFATNYLDVVSRAADTTGAKGQAFTTEYAGASNVVSRAGIIDPSWDASAFVDLPWDMVIDELERQGFGGCAQASCSFAHPLIFPMLRRYLVPPDGVDEGAFYGCPACYRNDFDPTTWDSVEFARELQERIVLPGVRAGALLDRWPYLTRMLTTISPEEMSVDPTFHERADLPDVAQRNTGRMNINMDGALLTFELPDERMVVLREDGTWPAFDTMPAADRVEQIPLDGDPTVVTDNRTAIDEALAESNDALGGIPDQTCNNGLGGNAGLGGTGGGGTGGVLGGTGGTGGGGTGGSGQGSAATGGTSQADPDGEPGPVRVGGGGCATSGGPSRPTPAVLLVGALLAFSRRRRLRQSRVP